MKGNKYLSELVDMSLLEKKKLNVIKAPTGSGKTWFALNYIPSITQDTIHEVVYLIDTINGKEQILKNYNTSSEYYGWSKDINDHALWFEPNKRIVVMSYARFGILTLKYPGFHNNFDYIICDELPSLLDFQNYSKKPNNHSVALWRLKNAVWNDRTTVIALTATPNRLKEDFGETYYEIPIDQEELKHYDVEQTFYLQNLRYILSLADTSEIGICYTAHISKMIQIQEYAESIGLSPVCLWSIKNKDHIMTPEQLMVRESILEDYSIPEGYNLLLINASSETSIKIKSPVDYVIINSFKEDTQIQVRGRVNHDLKRLYIPCGDNDPLDVPDEFLGVRLYRQDKEELCECVNRKNSYGRRYSWPTIKERLLEDDYVLTEGRYNNKRYVIITKQEL